MIPSHTLPLAQLSHHPTDHSASDQGTCYQTMYSPGLRSLDRFFFGHSVLRCAPCTVLRIQTIPDTYEPTGKRSSTWHRPCSGATLGPPPRVAAHVWPAPMFLSGPTIMFMLFEVGASSVTHKKERRVSSKWAGFSDVPRSASGGAFLPIPQHFQRQRRP